MTFLQRLETLSPTSWLLISGNSRPKQSNLGARGGSNHLSALNATRKNGLNSRVGWTETTGTRQYGGSFVG